MSITDHHINDCNRVIRVFRGHPVKDGATPDGNCYTIHAEGEAASDGVLVGYAVEYTLRFHTGDPREGINGVTNEALLAVVLDRLRHSQATGLACEQNEQALLNLEEALAWLGARSEERAEREVEGTQTP